MNKLISEKVAEFIKGNVSTSDEFCKTLTDLTTEVVKILAPYTEHRIECITQFEEDDECDCGLIDALKNLQV